MNQEIIEAQIAEYLAENLLTEMELFHEQREQSLSLNPIRISDRAHRQKKREFWQRF